MPGTLSENNLPCFKEAAVRGKCKTLTEKKTFRANSSVFIIRQKKFP
jgi:hypothetical protein